MKTRNEKYTDALDDLLDRPIAFNPAFLKMINEWLTNKAAEQGKQYGNAAAPASAIFLSQCFYWSKRTSDPEKWFYKSQKEWFEETGLTGNTQYTCRRILGRDGMNILEEKLKGVPATVHYRIHRSKIYQLFGFQFPEGQETEFPEGQETGYPIPQEPSFLTDGKLDFEGSDNFNNESMITSGITSKNTSISDSFSSWKKILDALEYSLLSWKEFRNVKPHLDQCKLAEYDDERMIIDAGTIDNRDWMTDRMKATIERALPGILQKEITVEFTTGS